jgi:hypothetical protein
MRNTDYQNIADQNERHKNMRYMGGGPKEEESDKAMDGPGGYFRARRIYSRYQSKKFD